MFSLLKIRNKNFKAHSITQRTKCRTSKTPERRGKKSFYNKCLNTVVCEKNRNAHAITSEFDPTAFISLPNFNGYPCEFAQTSVRK